MSPSRQTALAENIESLGITAEQLATLSAYVFSNEPDEAKAKRYLASLLSDTGSLQEALKNLGIHLATKPAKEPKPYPGEAQWVRPHRTDPSDTEWEEDRRCRIAYCMLVKDRRPIEEVADFLGVSDSEVTAMAECGRIKQSSAFVSPSSVAEAKARKAAADRRTSEHLERVAEFRRRA